MQFVPKPVYRGILALSFATVVTAVSIWTKGEMWDAADRMTFWMWLLFLTINGSFIWLLVLTWKRRNWARWAIAIWCALGWIALAISFATATASPLDRTFQVVTIAIEIWGCMQLFSRSASSWFRPNAAA
jgi:hypothetical protein